MYWAGMFETKSEEEKLKVVGLLVAVSRFGPRYQGLRVGTNVYRRMFGRERNNGRHQWLKLRNVVPHNSSVFLSDWKTDEAFRTRYKPERLTILI